MTNEGVEGIVAPLGLLAVTPGALRHTGLPRRRRWRRAAAVTGALVLLPFVPVSPHRDVGRPSADAPEGAGGGPPYDVGPWLARPEGRSHAASPVAYRERDAASPAAPATEERETIATLGDLELSRLSPDTALIGFHEANGETTLSVDPSGPVQQNHNPGKSEVATDARAPVEPPAMVLPPRDRASGPHSAIDVAMPLGSDVWAPVTGRVVNVQEYALYGTHADTRIEIVPDARPDVVVIMLHVSGPQVAAGDRVVGGRTVVADSPAQFPFASQIDRFAARQTGHALPHVHIELKRIA